MANTRKATPIEDKQTEATDTMTALYTKSVERLAEAQKTTLDTALEQNADLIGAWKKIAQAVPGTPVPSILDLAANTFGQFVDLQKGAIDLALEQSSNLTGLAKERAAAFTAAGDTVTAIAQDTLVRAQATQKTAIDLATSQTKAVFDAFKKQPGIAGTPFEAAADTFHRGFNSLIETQKEMFALASKQTYKATA